MFPERRSPFKRFTLMLCPVLLQAMDSGRRRLAGVCCSAPTPAAGGIFGYDRPAALTVRSLAQAAAIAACEAVDQPGERLITEAVVNGVIVPVARTAVRRPIPTRRCGRRLLTGEGRGPTGNGPTSPRRG